MESWKNSRTTQKMQFWTQKYLFPRSDERKAWLQTLQNWNTKIFSKLILPLHFWPRELHGWIKTGVEKQYDLYQINLANISQESSDHMMLVQSVRIASCRGNSTSLPSSGGSQQIQSKLLCNTPINFAAQYVLSSAKHNRTAQEPTHIAGVVDG